MVAAQLFVLPLLILGFGGWYVIRTRSGATTGIRFHRYGLALLGDVWLVLIAIAAPLGPHPWMFLGLVFLNVGVAYLALSDVFGMGRAGAAHGTPGRGRYRSTRSDTRYRGYRGD